MIRENKVIRLKFFNGRFSWDNKVDCQSTFLKKYFQYHPKAKDKWAKKSMEYSEIGSIKFEFEFLEKDSANGINSKNDLLKILPKLITEYGENLKNSQK